MAKIDQKHNHQLPDSESEVETDRSEGISIHVMRNTLCRRQASIRANIGIPDGEATLSIFLWNVLGSFYCSIRYRGKF